MPNSFFWYELMTSDTAAAGAFYSAIIGWDTESAGAPNDRYSLFTLGGKDRGVAGMMEMPEDYSKAGGKPCWTGYIKVDDVDAAAQRLKQAGGAIHKPPTDIPEVGRFAVVADSQGTMFNIMKPKGEDQPSPPGGTPGFVGWHELYAVDGQSAFDFYAGQFGWTKAEALNMGPMGIYQLFAAGGDAVGGIMTKPKEIPAPAWQFYFNVEAADATAARIAEKDGRVLMGPHEVPGGSWIVQAVDPQGAMFAVVAPRR